MFRLMVIFFLPTLSEPEKLPIEGRDHKSAGHCTD